MLLEDTEDLGAGDALHLRDTEGVTEGDTDLGRRGALLGQLADVLDNLREREQTGIGDNHWRQGVIPIVSDGR